MGELYRSDICDVDINKSLLRTYVGMVLATGDKLANRFGVNVYRQRDAVDLTGSAVTGYFIRPNTETVVIPGTVEGNTAYVDLPQACYTNDGTFSLAIKINKDDVTMAVRVIDGCIRLTQTDALVDPGEAVPNLDDIFAQIAAVENATANANQATETANAAAANADAKALELTQVVNAVINDIAPAIVPTAAGNVIAVTDSADRPAKGLRLYGKTMQDGTPTPDAPVELVSAGNNGSIGVNVCGKNVLNMPSWSITHNGISAIAEGSELVFYGTATGALGAAFLSKGKVYLPAGTYTISANGVAAISRIEINSYENISGTQKAHGNVDGTTPQKTVTLTKASSLELTFVVAKGTELGTESNPTIIKIQVESGTTATAYEPYKDCGSVIVSTPNGLPGIPVTSGGNYTDASGQQWVCDEIDFERGVYVQRVAVIALNGANYPAYEYAAYPNVYRFDITASGYRMAVGVNNAYCSHYQYAGTTTAASAVTDDKTFKIYRNNSDPSVTTCSVYVKDTTYSTLDAIKAALATEPLTVAFPIREYIETALSAAEQEAFAELRTNYGNTTACNDAGAGMQIDYVADTKLYIDQKIAAIATAIVNA